MIDYNQEDPDDKEDGGYSLNRIGEIKIVQANWDRYQYSRGRGHDLFVANARENEDMYLGGGLQWAKEDREYLESQGRPTVEVNGIFPAVNTAIGMQLGSRADISFKPRGGTSDEQVAEVLTKVTMQICDDIKYPWLETQMFSDGMIQQRGYLDFRVDFDENMKAKITCEELDPLDVLPDPDAQSYDPKRWNDVIKVKWMTIDDICETYGEDKRDDMERTASTSESSGDDDAYDKRSKFGEISDSATYSDSGLEDDVRIKRYLVVDRQYSKMEMEESIVTAMGEVKSMEGMTPESIASMQAQGGCCTKRMIRKIRWTVSTADVLLFDEWSPYKTKTVIPYFPFFRRGRTRGMVDNAKSPQQLLNKSISQYLHILNTSANSGYFVEKGSLTNMETADLQHVGAKTGIVIEFAKGSTQPSKIQPNQMPQGLDRLIDRTETAIKTVTGISDAQQGLNGNEVSGVAIRTKQYSGQAQLGGPLDNLARTRHLVAEKLLELVQGFMTEEQLMMITDSNAGMQATYTPLIINQMTPEGTIINDLTVGEYDVVISDMPTQSTFADNQYQQAMEMRKEGIAIPDSAVIEMSSLTKKHELAKLMSEQAGPPADPLNEAKAAVEQARVALVNAQTAKTQQESVNRGVDAQYSAMQSAAIIAASPQVAPMADALLLSAGYQDQDASPIVPQSLPGLSPADNQQSGLAILPPNTNPTTPAPVPTPQNAAVGANAGIETPVNEPLPGDM